MATKRLNYVEIWNDHQKGMTKDEIAKKYKCTSEAVRRVLVMGSAFADSIGTPKGLDAYQPRELMRHLASLGFRGKLQYLQEVDITKL